MWPCCLSCSSTWFWPQGADDWSPVLSICSRWFDHLGPPTATSVLSTNNQQHSHLRPSLSPSSSLSWDEEYVHSGRRYLQLELSRKFSDVQISTFYVLLLFFSVLSSPLSSPLFIYRLGGRDLHDLCLDTNPWTPPAAETCLQKLKEEQLHFETLNTSYNQKRWCWMCSPLRILLCPGACVCECVIVMVWGVFTERECEEVWDGVGERSVRTCGLPNPSISGMTAVTTSRCLGAQSDWLFTVNIDLFTLQCVLFAPLAVSKLMLNPSTDP